MVLPPSILNKYFRDLEQRKPSRNQNQILLFANLFIPCISNKIFKTQNKLR